MFDIPSLRQSQAFLTLTLVRLYPFFIYLHFCQFVKYLPSTVCSITIRSVEVGANLNALHLVSTLNDIEDINETQIFAIRDIKYIALDEEIKGLK